MSCQRAQEMDLLAFAADRHASEWSEFRDHYPRCAECSAAVAGLSQLELLLRQAGAGGMRAESAEAGIPAGAAHLSEEQLLGFADGTLEPAAASRLEAHLAGCPACRTELNVLRQFEWTPQATLAVVKGEGAPDRAPSRAAGLGTSRLRARRERAWRPEPVWGLVAAAAALALVLWTLSPRDPTESPPQLAQRPAPTRPVAPPTTPGIKPPITPRTPRITPPITPEGMPAESAPKPVEQLAERVPDPGSTRIDPPAPEIESPRTAPEREAPSAESGEREVVLLAALLPSELPSYARPKAMGGGSLRSVRIEGMLRGAARSAPRVSVLAPVHVGRTRVAAPTLHWALEKESPYPVELVVSDPDADEPLLETRLAPPVAAGDHALDLAVEGITLRPGTAYDWSVSVVVDEEKRESDVVAAGGLLRVPDSEAARALPSNGVSESAALANRVHRLASEGYWYDAYAELSRWIEAHPELDRLHDYRRALLVQAGLDDAADWIEGR